MHSPLPARSRLVGVLISCSLLGSLTGCGTGSTSETPRTTTSAANAPGGTSSTVATTTTAATTAATTAPARQKMATVYFLNADATELIKTQMPGPNTPARIKAALSVLAAATPPDGAVAAFPAGTEVVAVSLHDDEARVELSDAFVTGYPAGGAAAELAVLAPIIYTATDAPGVSRVRITVNGEAPQLPGSQFDWASPFSRDDLPDLPVTTR